MTELIQATGYEQGGGIRFSAASSTLLCPVRIPRQIAQQNTLYSSF